MNRKKVVVIGAGQTGRGYLGRYLFENNYDFAFIDKNEELVRLMQEDKAFSIHFYKKDRTPLYVENFETYLSHSKEATKKIHEADLIFTCVFEENLKDVALQLKEGLKGKDKTTEICTAENGINPGKILKKYLNEYEVYAPYKIGMTAVFCSTIKIASTRLDILSMNMDWFPYDADNLEPFGFKGEEKVHNFTQLLQRKIWTYNCLAGIISYCGYIKGYEIYGDAANENEIKQLQLDILEELNPALQDYFNISKEDQEAFAQRAFEKMIDKSIYDLCMKTARAAFRKLGPTERIMSPMKILLENNKDVKILEFNAAAALVFWEEQQGNGTEPMLDKHPIDKFCEINNLSRNNAIVKNVEKYYNKIKENRNDIKIYDILNN